MALDPNLPLQIQQPNPANFISSFVDLGRKKLDLDKARETFESDVAQRKAEASSAQSAAKVSEASVGPDIRGREASAQSAEAQASALKLSTMRQHIRNARQETTGLLSLEDSKLTPDAVKASLVKSLTNSGASPQAIQQAISQIPASGSPLDLRNFVVKGLVQSLEAEGQLDRQYPSPTYVNDGQQARPVAAGNPAITGIAPGSPQGVPTQMQIPPTAPTMSPAGVPGYYGAQPPQRAGGGAAPVQSGPAIGQASGIEGPIAAANDHYKAVQLEAQSAPTKLAALQTIKEEIPKAVMGGGSVGDVLRKLSAVFGFANDSATANDVMAKNLAIIAGRAGNTDAARALAEMGTPNYKMTTQAANKTADQLIGILKRDQAAGDFFAGTPTNSPDYTAKMQAWNKYGDPRAFEYASKTPGERAVMKMEMQKAGTWDTLSRNMIQIDKMGINP